MVFNRDRSLDLLPRTRTPDCLASLREQGRTAIAKKSRHLIDRPLPGGALERSTSSLPCFARGGRHGHDPLYFRGVGLDVHLAKISACALRPLLKTGPRRTRGSIVSS
jgi:hypothetical protein